MYQYVSIRLAFDEYGERTVSISMSTVSVRLAFDEYGERTVSIR